MKRFFLTIIFLSSLCFSLTFLPYFSITNIQSNDLTFIPLSEFNEVVEPYSNKAYGHYLWHRPLHRFLSRHPKVQSYSFSFNFPDTITVTIEEKQPWMSCMVDGQSILIDKEGVILSAQNDSIAFNTDNLFVVKGLDEKDFLDGHVSDELFARLQTLHRFFTTFLPEKQVLIEENEFGDWSLLIDDMLFVIIGALDKMDSKFQRLNYFLQSQDSQDYSKIEYIDCRVAKKLLVKYGS